MHTTRLGHSGLQVSRICLGMMSFGSPDWRPWIQGEEAARPIVRRAVELGINFFDTADTYSAGESEVVTGKLLRECATRDEVVITTKVYNPVSASFKSGQDPTSIAQAQRPNQKGLSRKRIFSAVDASLKRLGTDYIDLYQIHRWDYDTPVEEFMETLHDVVKAGKARYIGASSMWAWQFAQAQHVAERHGWTRFVSMQNHYNLVYREEEREMLPLLRESGVGCIPWSPLARGYLAKAPQAAAASPLSAARLSADALRDRYYGSAADIAVLDAVGRIADAHGATRAQIACAWLLSPDSIAKGVAAPIVGANTIAHLEALAAAPDITLTVEQIHELQAPYVPKPILGHV